MSHSAKLLLAIISLSLFYLLIGSVPQKSPVAQGTSAKWLHHLRIKPKQNNKTKLVMGTKIVKPDLGTPSVEDAAKPAVIPEVKGVYLTAWKAGNSQFIYHLSDFVAKTEVNSVVVDVKDDCGTISYGSKVQLVKQIGANLKKFDPQLLLKVLEENKIYVIARIVVFKDPLLAKACPDLAVRNGKGELWSDRKGTHWVDPYNRKVWDYNLEIAKEAAEMGFKEIQFDYIRFTSDGNISECRYPADNGETKSEVIGKFLKQAKEILEPLGVKVSADVFGLTCSAKDDLGIGQDFVLIAQNVDIICPMVYPSHYYKGQYNIADPDSKPYETILHSLLDAKEKLAKAQVNTVVRPWLQDFSLLSHYNRQELMAQIHAVEDVGLNQWLFWNPQNNYDVSKYLVASDDCQKYSK